MSEATYKRTLGSLTRAERRVYALIVRKGCVPEEIAHRLGISPNTVRQHQRQILMTFKTATVPRLIVQYKDRELAIERAENKRLRALLEKTN